MPAEGKRPSWRVSLLYLAGLGALFYASYGFSNWLASKRPDVPSIVFPWESGVAFVAWMIVPYWTTNLFYAASLFLCRTREEFMSHVRRLVTAQIISVFFFIFFPLKFSWPKPDTSGAFHFLYESLAAFDKPFNQAPSLHVALTIILASLYLKILPRRGRILFGLWSTLVLVSVMTTYQHHFIDIPTGTLLGLFCVWLWPSDGSRRITAWRRARGQEMALAWCYIAGAAGCALAAFLLRGGFLWMLWPAFALFGVAMAYLGLEAAVFDKRLDGKMGWPSRILLFPYLFAAKVNSRLWTRNDRKNVEVAENVFLGRFPASKDLAGISAVVDLTCEFSRADPSVRWICIPMLDLVAPSPASLRAAADIIEQQRQQGPVLVVCALGYGRSIAAMLTWLVRTRRETDIESAIARLRLKRPKLSVSEAQLNAVREAVHG